MERVSIYLDRDDPAPGELKGYFAEVFVSMDAHPRPLLVSVFAGNDRRARVSVTMEAGEPVFHIKGRESVRANFRGRWLAEHPSPLVLSPHRATHLALIPTTGNRVKVRRATLLERLFA